jgi:hypothetical protein
MSPLELRAVITWDEVGDWATVMTRLPNWGMGART